MRFVVLLLCVCAALAGVGGRAVADGSLGSSLPAGAVEDVVARTAFSSTFGLPDGSKATVVSSTQANVQDADGTWRPIDDGLRRASDGSLVNGRGPLDVRIPASVSDPVAVARGDRSVAMQLQGADGPVRLDGSTARFDSALTGVGVDYAVHGRELKETLRVRGDAVPTVFRFAV